MNTIVSDQTTEPQPIRVERFSTPGLAFEVSADLGLARNKFSGFAGRPEDGPSSSC